MIFKNVHIKKYFIGYSYEPNQKGFISGLFPQKIQRLLFFGGLLLSQFK
jgi:hypothetical protein